MSTGAPTLIIATLKVRYGQHARFNEVFGKLVDETLEFVVTAPYAPREP